MSVTITQIVSSTVSTVTTNPVKFTEIVQLWSNPLAASVHNTYTQNLTETLLYVDTKVNKATKYLTDVVLSADTYKSNFVKLMVLTEVLLDVEVSLLKTITHTLTDVVQSIDGVTKTANRTFSEVLNTVDSHSKQITRTFNETMLSADVFVKNGQKVLTEIVYSADSIQRSVNKILTEILLSSDPGFLWGQVIQLLQTVSATVIDGLQSVQIVPVVLVQYVNTSVALPPIVWLTDTVSFIETFVPGRLVFIYERINNRDKIIKTAVRTFSEVLRTNEVYVNVGHVYTVVLNEMLSLVETFGERFAPWSPRTILLNEFGHRVIKYTAFITSVFITNNVLTGTQSIPNTQTSVTASTEVGLSDEFGVQGSHAYDITGRRVFSPLTATVPLQDTVKMIDSVSVTKATPVVWLKK